MMRGTHITRGFDASRVSAMSVPTPEKIRRSDQCVQSCSLCGEVTFRDPVALQKIAWLS